MATITAAATPTVARKGFRIPPVPRVLTHIVLILIGIIWLEPTVGLLITSFRTREDISSTPWWTVIWQPHFTIQNYISVLTAQGMGTSFVNSFLITIPGTIIPIIVASLALFWLLEWLVYVPLRVGEVVQRRLLHRAPKRVNAPHLDALRST